MSDKPLVVEFDTPYSAFRDLASQRHRLRGAAEDIQHAMQDVNRFQADASNYATIAAAWAATLMVADILKIGLSAMDRRARVLFAAQDRTIERANKALKLLGLRTMTTKADLMKTVDPNLQGAVKLMADIRAAREFLKKQGINAPKEMNLLLDLGTAMADDAVLIMQAGQLQRQARSNANAARNNMRNSLSRINQRIKIVDQELTRLIDRAMTLSRTA